MKMNEKLFNICLNYCSKTIKTHTSDPEVRLDFESKIYAKGLKNDFMTISKYLPENSNVLDIGCGKGHISALLSKSGFSVHGIDVENTVGEQLNIQESKWQKPIWNEFESKFKVKYQFYNGRKIPFKDNSFDGIVAYAVLEHVSFEILNEWLNEIYRVLKKDGYFFIFRCPRKQSYAEAMASVMGLPGHERLFYENEIINILNKHKFIILKLYRQDMIISFPPLKLQKLWNFMFPFISLIDSLLLKTLFSYYAHHMAVVAKKVTVSEENGN